MIKGIVTASILAGIFAITAVTAANASTTEPTEVSTPAVQIATISGSGGVLAGVDLGNCGKP